MSYTQSKTWKSPAVVARERWLQIVKPRQHICPRSPFLTIAFDEVAHKAAIDEAKAKLIASKSQASALEKETRERIEAETGRSNQLRPFQRRNFSTTRGTVTSQETIWCPQWQIERVFIAPWPSQEELKYERARRDATSTFHGSCLPLPRMPPLAGLHWSQTPYMLQPKLDRTQEVTFDHSVTDEDGVNALGFDLMAALDPSDIYV